MFLTCRNVILTLQEKKLDVDVGYPEKDWWLGHLLF